MKVLIPTIGSELMLDQPWTFRLFNERRNQNLLDHFGIIFKPYCECKNWEEFDNQSQEVTLSANTILKIARIYIRGSYREFDSVTFSIQKNETFKKCIRFWAKLDDVNRMEILYVI